MYILLALILAAWHATLLSLAARLLLVSEVRSLSIRNCCISLCMHNPAGLGSAVSLLVSLPIGWKQSSSSSPSADLGLLMKFLLSTTGATRYGYGRL